MKGILSSKIRQGLKDIMMAFTRREHLFMIVMGGIVGVAGGYGAIGFRRLITATAQIGWGNVTRVGGKNLLVMALAAPIWAKILIPTIGGLLVGILVYYFAQEAKGHGVPEVMEAVILRGGRMRTRVVLVKAFASALCIGSGGSVGREGPIVQIGSAMGSAIGTWFKMSGARVRTLVVCGAAAGIAATFNAPIAGTLFPLEIIVSEFGASQLIAIVVSSVTATALSRHYLGNFPAFKVPPYELLQHGELFLYLILGVLAGLVAYAFIRLLYGMEDFFERWKCPELIKPAIGGAILGCIGLLFPQIFGVGYESVTQVLGGEVLGIALLGLLIAKILATSITIGSGGSGGIFAPSLFMGAVLGAAFGQIVHALFPYATGSPGAYALVGMGAVVSGTTRAPITAMLIIFEMTANYRIILPLMFACIISLVIASLLSRDSIYTLKLVRRGVNLYGGKELNVLKPLKVTQVMTPEIELVPPSAPLPDLVARMMMGSHLHLYVLGNNQKIQGQISLENLGPILKDYESVCGALIAADLMDKAITVVDSEESLDVVMRLFEKFDLDEIPVENKGQLVGTIRKSDVIKAYNREIFKADMASGLATSLCLQQNMHQKQVSVGGGFLILEAAAPRMFVGESLEALKLRERFGATVLTIKRPAKEQAGEVSYLLPTPSTIIQDGDVLTIFGLQKDLSNFPCD
jgi:CIC family chloride channel protein